MNPTLYTTAVALLDHLQSDWFKLVARIAAVVGNINRRGSEIQRILQTEDQLDATTFAELLRALCLTSWPDDEETFISTYEDTLKRFQLKGKPITLSRPAWLFRYVNGPGLFNEIIKALRSDFPLSSTLTEAQFEANNGELDWSVVLDFIQDPDVWRHLPLQNIRLGRGDFMFITFDPDPHQPLDRDSAQWIHDALALWLPLRAGCLVQLRYPRKETDELRYPTAADAGWFSFFSCAPQSEPHGWTRPHFHADRRQPEAVQRVVMLDRLQRPEDLTILA